MTKTEVKSKLAKVTAKIKELNAIPEVAYVTVNKYLPAVGTVSELQSKTELVKALAEINSLSYGFDAAMEELGVELTDKQKPTILGYSSTVWKTDIKNRLKKLMIEDQINELLKAKKVLTKHLSEDDIFEMDMDKIGNGLNLING